MAVQARRSLKLSKYHIVGNHMSRLKYKCLTVIRLDCNKFIPGLNPLTSHSHLKLSALSFSPVFYGSQNCNSVDPDQTALCGGGAWQLSGIVLDLRSRCCMFELHQRHCVIFFSKTLYPPFSTGSTKSSPIQT